MDSLEKIDKLANLFSLVINMLSNEIEENKESLNSLDCINNLILEWNAIVDENLEEI